MIIPSFFLIVTHILFFIAGMFHARLERGYKASKSEPPLLAKEIPLGSKYFFKHEEVEIIAYSKQGDQVVVIENAEGKVWCENINDVICGVNLQQKCFCEVK